MCLDKEYSISSINSTDDLTDKKTQSGVRGQGRDRDQKTNRHSDNQTTSGSTTNTSTEIMCAKCITTLLLCLCIISCVCASRHFLPVSFKYDKPLVSHTSKALHVERECVDIASS